MHIQMPEYYKSTNGKDMFRYQNDRTNGDREYWKCEDRSCRARAVTNKRDIVSVSEDSHAPDPYQETKRPTGTEP